MPPSRISFEQLPSVVVDAVEKHTGSVIKTESGSEGLNSQVSARIHTESGTFFVKGMHTDRAQSWTQRREAEVNPYVRAVAPALRWEVATRGWHLLGFDALNGRHADYSTGSPDLPIVVDMLSRLSEIPCPDIELRYASQRLSKYVDDPDESRLFDGDSLLHTDLNNANVLVDGRAFLVDWGWATKGAAWLDAGYWVIWLMAAGGHTPESAEWWASQVPAWRSAQPEGVDAFAEANAKLWKEIGGDEPDHWTARMVRASREWARFRRSG
jgi:hypothetical protein